MTDTIPPVITSMLICDRHETKGGKMNLIGVHDRIKHQKYPVELSACEICFTLGSGHGEALLLLEFFKIGAEDTILQSLPMPIDFKGPLASHDCHAVLKGLRIPAAGQYRFRLSCGKSHLMEIPFHALLF